MRCEACGFQFEGIAIQCPRCEAPLRRAPALAPAPPSAMHARPPGFAEPRRPGLSGRQWTAVVAVAVLVAGVVLASLFYVTFLMYFCLDLDLFGGNGVDDCADEDAAAQRFLNFVVFPAALIAGGLTGYGMYRLFQRRNGRPKKAPAEAPLSTDVPTHRRG